MRFNNDRPIFTQIAELLTAEVLSGRLPPGGRLPSARDLAVSLEVNPNTASRALQALADSGIARCERGSGYFVAERGTETAREERRKRFHDEELPRFFGLMEELGLSIEDIGRQWAERGSAKE